MVSENSLFKNFHPDIWHIKDTIKSSDLNKKSFYSTILILSENLGLLE